MHVAFSRTDHRPWPLPTGRWCWRQNWYNLLFAHYRVDISSLRKLVPDGLRIQEFDGSSWVGVVPFRMTGVMRRPFPDLPGISAFPELNVRLYVERDGKPGVWFLSLDASNRLAVWAARRFFHLPYHHARMMFTHDGDGVRFQAQRSQGDVAFSATYRPLGESFPAGPGTLEEFLTERYCLYSQSPRGRLFRCEVHHQPWPLQRAEAELDLGSLLSVHGIDVADQSPLLHYSRGVETVVWPLERVD